jgi:hypothetical protein
MVFAEYYYYSLIYLQEMSGGVDWPAILYTEYLDTAFNYIYHNYVDLYYVQWLIYIFYPLVITFLLPAAIVVFLYASSLFLQLYRLRRHFSDVYSMDFWDGARQIVAALWDAQGKIWHGKEAASDFIVMQMQLMEVSVFLHA